ncbi:WD-40 repeat protein [Oscillochloris trichoides DG-6]|uniref:WD-40 repeat protein n=1 Tax=Oscillochloris trichoides DG-6 TaxID=765420 RepID=E1ID07_9CHLR|nr:WD40 repeat domain-containing protein [Oscillochloris trichoides]EFO80916.1 WD-40 repeat protein [Oscillochloris trichoides DG-6]
MSQRTEHPLRLVLACAPEDLPAVRALTQRLRVDGLSPWLIGDELADQSDALRPLRAAVAAADGVLFCLSRRSFHAEGQPAADIARLLDLIALHPPPAPPLVLRLAACDLPAALDGALVCDLFAYRGYLHLLDLLQDTVLPALPLPEPAPPPPPPPHPALALRGRFALPGLADAGQLGRLGRGVARNLWLLSPHHVLMIAGGGATLLALDDPKPLWAIDCPTRHAALSPTGRLLALAAGDHIWLWDLHDGSLRNQIQNAGSSVLALAFSPDEHYLLSASDDRCVALWRTGNDVLDRATPLLATLPPHPDQVLSLAFSPDGSLLACGGADRSVRIWRMLDRSLVQTLSGHGGAVETLAFSPDGNLLAAGSRGRSLRLWRVASWRLLHSLDGHNGAVETLAWSPDGQLVASGASDQTLRVWQVKNAALVRSLNAHSGAIMGVSFCPQGERLASVADDDRLLVWRVADGAEVGSLRPLSGRVTGLAFSPDGEGLAVSGADGAVSLYPLYQASGPQRQYHDHRGPVGSIVFSGDGTRLLSAASDRSVRDYQIATGQCRILLQTHGPNHGAQLAPGGQWLASSDGEATVQIWQLDASGGQFWRVLRGLRGRPGLLGFSPDAQRLAISVEDGSLQIWHLDAGAADLHPQTVLVGLAGRVRSLAFSPDGSSLATGCATGQVQIWQVQNASLRSTLGGPGPACVGVAFSPDGRSLAVGDSSGRILVWALAGKQRGKNEMRRNEPSLLRQIPGHAGEVSHLAYNPSGDLLVSGSSDGTVRLWQV